MIAGLNPSRLFPLLGLAAAIAVGVLVSASVANAQATFAVLHSFNVTAGDGSGPYASLIQGPDGTLYGTTNYGGTGRCFIGGLPIGCGTVFQLAPDGTGYMVLHSFTGGPGGSVPWAGLTQGPDGTLYGTTVGGGTSDFGTVFQLAPDGTGYMVLHSFTGGPGGSSLFSAGLTQGPDGTLYGTTQYGGTDDRGTIFEMAPDGSGYMVLHSFAGADGSRPMASLTQGPDGTLFGTTYAGGTFNQGTIFQLAPDGSGFTVLHSFTVGDAENPSSGLIQGSDGTLYGTTAGMTTSTLGTVFQMAPDGSGFTVLHSFTGPPTDGSYPVAALIQGPDGTLYGTTQYGGTDDRGTIFQLAPDGSSFAVLHNFAGGVTDGYQPWASLIQGLDGALYGTTYSGGTGGGGVVFQLTLPSSAPTSTPRMVQQ